jgi:Fur family transcriptional regulator, ferric uptake regulator
MCKSTDSGAWSELSSEQINNLARLMHDHGLQLTMQRQAVYQAIAGCPGHICAEHIQKVIQDRWPGLRMNKTTVYRNLDLLVSLGLISEHRCDDGPAQYEPADRGRHSHMICRRCGTMMNLDPAIVGSMEQRLLEQHGFKLDLSNYPVSGVCARCGD